jgi:hypothetical protein
MSSNRTTIDRLALEVPGASAEAGRSVALLVVAALAEAGGIPAVGDRPGLSVKLVADPGLPPSELAQRIVAEILRTLQQSP